MVDSTKNNVLVSPEKIYLFLAAIGALCFVAATLLASSRSPFLDEAAYIHNLYLPLVDYFEMLPYYDAARPPAVSLMLAPVWQATGSIVALRLTVLLAFVASLTVFAVSIARHRNVLTACAALLFVCALPEAVRYATEVKHFGLEMAAAMVLLAALIPLSERAVSGKQAALIALLVLTLSLFSLSIILVLLAVAGERFLFSRDSSVSFSWALVACASLLVWTPCYLWVHQPILVAQLNNYPDVYEAFSLANSWHSQAFWQHTFRQLVLLFGGTALLGVWFFVLGLGLVAQASKVLGSQFIFVRMLMALVLGIVLASLLDQYPITSSRQLLFIVPLVALAFASAISALVERFHWLVGVVLVVPVLALATLNLKDALSGDFDHQPLHALMGAVEEHPADMVVMFNAIQPGWVLLEDVEQKFYAKTVLAWVPPGTGLRPNWQQVEGNFAETIASPIAWSALSHLRDKQRFDLYTDWLVEQIPAEKTVLLPLAQMFPDRTKALKTSLTHRGCLYERIYLNKGVQLYEISCPTVSSKIIAVPENSGEP